MRKILLLSLFILSVSLFLTAFSYDNNSAYNEKHEAFTIKVETEAEALYYAESFNLTLEKVSRFNIATFRATQNTDVSAVLAAGFSVNYVSRSAIYSDGASLPNDFYLDEQYSLEMLNIFGAWELTTGEEHITVAIIDTGIDINHAEFQHNLSPLSYNAYTDEVGIEYVDDDEGHGTLVAGVLGAAKNNNVGIAGIAPNVEMLIIKANTPQTDQYPHSVLADGIYYAIENGADIINLSLGSYSQSQILHDAILAAVEAGIYVVAAAGNDNTSDTFYPAGFDEVISVGSVNNQGTRSSFSNFGESIDIAAPGSDIITTRSGNFYTYASGTSLASPQIAGILALMLSYDEEITYLEGLEMLRNGQYSFVDDFENAGIPDALLTLETQLNRIEFLDKEGNVFTVQYILDNSFVEPVEALEIEDLLFIDWYLDAHFELPFDDAEPIDQNITLFPRYEPAFFTVQLIIDEELFDELIVPYGDMFTPEIPLREDYTFFGWYLDATFETNFEPIEVFSDITLYGYFDPIIYYTVTLIYDNEVYQEVLVEEGTTFEFEPKEKIGHHFEGFYTDTELTEAIEELEITDNIELYLRFDPKLYNLELMSEDGSFETLEVAFGSIPILPTPEKENHTFMGWYLDEALTLRYQNTPILEDTVLYARFAEMLYNVSYTFGDDLLNFERIESGQAAPIIIPEIIGHEFLGWYLDDAFTIPYTDQPIESNTVLYAKTQQNTYTVIFKDYQNNMIDEQVVLGGEAAQAPDTFDQPSSEVLSFEFIEWSADFEVVGEDLILTPIYKETFNTELVSLEPSKDTIRLGEGWEDFGVAVKNDAIHFNRVGEVDDSQAGRYTVYYEIIYNDTVYYHLTRIVTVIERQVPEIVLNPGISTLWEGMPYVEAGVTITHGELEILGEVDTNHAGRYIITYRVTYEDIIVERTRLVNVLAVEHLEVRNLTPFFKREGEDYVA